MDNDRLKEKADDEELDKRVVEREEKEEALAKKWEKAHAARMTEIVPGLFLGNVKASYQRDMLQENGVNALVSLTDARWVWWNSTTREAGIPEYRHKWVQCTDSSTQDLLIHLNDICDFMDQVASSTLLSSSTFPSDHRPGSADKPKTSAPEAILVHCDLGISRSPTVIVAYLMRKYGTKLEDVLDFVQQKQKVKPSSNLLRQLRIWEQVRYQVWADDERADPKALYQAFLDERAALLKEKGLRGDEPMAPQDL